MKAVYQYCVTGILMGLATVSFHASADDSAALKKKLATLNQFSAHFEQDVFDAQGKPLQKGNGDMTLQRPEHLRWDVKKPDESLIVSDGKAVWMYDPFVEQVTVMGLDKAMVNTPFLLLSSTDEKVWSQYTIDQNGTAFTVTPKKKDQRIASLRLVFQGNQITRLEVDESQGQRSEFTLSNFTAAPMIKSDTFSFKVPEGVTVDDQRE
jgi:outer membrane lipoprotein carrier protein